MEYSDREIERIAPYTRVKQGGLAALIVFVLLPVTETSICYRQLGTQGIYSGLLLGLLGSMFFTRVTYGVSAPQWLYKLWRCNARGYFLSSKEETPLPWRRDLQAGADELLISLGGWSLFKPHMRVRFDLYTERGVRKGTRQFVIKGTDRDRCTVFLPLASMLKVMEAMRPSGSQCFAQILVKLVANTKVSEAFIERLGRNLEIASAREVQAQERRDALSGRLQKAHKITSHILTQIVGETRQPGEDGKITKVREELMKLKDNQGGGSPAYSGPQTPGRPAN